MIRKALGYTIAAIGFIGFGFFKNYKGSIIPYPTVWYIIFFLFFAIGLSLVYFTKSLSKQEKLNKDRLDRLKQNGEKILLSLGNCEIRENNYYEEVEPDNSSKIQQIDALYDPNRNYKQKYIEQSAIIYYYTATGKRIRMTSQSFPFDAALLKRHIENNKVYLFVNRFNKQDYEFEITG